MTEIRIEPWSEGDLDLLRRINVPEMKRHLGGPETDEQVVARHERYVKFAGTGKGCMFRVVLLPEREPVGSIGYWEREWARRDGLRDGLEHPAGVPGERPGHRGRCRLGRRRPRAAQKPVRPRVPVGRQPRFERGLPPAGFQLLGETKFEFPPGRPMRSNEWRLDLSADS